MKTDLKQKIILFTAAAWLIFLISWPLRHPAKGGLGELVWVRRVKNFGASVEARVEQTIKEMSDEWNGRQTKESD